ncbi:MAG: hypothetical protein JW929_11700, partial [Anaerolineales bacterium]|nr:hypothetical protein [Anaerolineales bacterium]
GVFVAGIQPWKPWIPAKPTPGEERAEGRRGNDGLPPAGNFSQIPLIYFIDRHFFHEIQAQGK